MRGSINGAVKIKNSVSNTMLLFLAFSPFNLHKKASKVLLDKLPKDKLKITVCLSVNPLF